ncbi:hypothetical protein [Bacillus sp. FJAT-29937]|uniref:hypothetical protein n=1 Tax=Bacillus sp. FJAT-29937 TaxID=1720553 RepID=UPI000834D1A0|nr:hypothetical protein [Bacillus sp. FJAT-29937]
MKTRSWLLAIFAVVEITRLFALEVIKDKLSSIIVENAFVEYVMSIFELEIPIGLAIIIAIGISMGVQHFTEKSSTDKYNRNLNRRRNFFHYILQGRYTPTVLSPDQKDEIKTTFKGIMDKNDEIAGIQIYQVEHENDTTEINFKLNPLVSYTTEGSNEINSTLSINVSTIKEFFDALQSTEDKANFYEKTIKHLNNKTFSSKNLGLYMLLDVLIEDDYKNSSGVIPRDKQILNDKNKDNRYKQASKLGLLKAYFGRAVSEDIYTFEKMDGSNDKKNRNYVVINMNDQQHLISIILKNSVPHDQKAKVIKTATIRVKRKLRKIEKTAIS